MPVLVYVRVNPTLLWIVNTLVKNVNTTLATGDVHGLKDLKCLIGFGTFEPALTRCSIDVVGKVFIKSIQRSDYDGKGHARNNLKGTWQRCSWYNVFRVLCGLGTLKAPPTRTDIDYYKINVFFQYRKAKNTHVYMHKYS